MNPQPILSGARRSAWSRSPTWVRPMPFTSLRSWRMR